jgi:hypothetical protein
MDTTVSGIGAAVVAELRAAGYMESTVGQYAKTIKALTEFASGRGYSTSLGAEFASMTTSVRTGRFSPQRRFDYRRLVAVFDSYVQSGRVDLSVRGRGGGAHSPRAAISLRWMPLGRPRWAAAVWHRPPARPMEGWRVATWCSWKDAGSPGSARLMAPVCWRFGASVRSVGQVVAVLGGVELSSVPQVHRPHRPGQCAESGWGQTFSRDSPRPHRWR